MSCKRCNKKLVGKQISYCSERCSRLHLKALYRRRNKPKILAYNRIYKKAKSSRVAKHYGEGHANCFRCGVTQNLHTHHIKPKEFGGDNRAANLMVLCRKCHVFWHRKMVNFWIKKAPVDNSGMLE